MGSRVPDTLLESILATEGSIACLAVESKSVRRRVSDMLLESILAVEGAIAGHATIIHVVDGMSFYVEESIKS